MSKTLGDYFNDNQNYNTYMFNEMAMKIRDDILMELSIHIRSIIREELRLYFPSKGANGTPKVEAEVNFDEKQLQEAFEDAIAKLNRRK
ncbi:hypothetical protein LJC74_10200 [Eubacteriales bacterium OttesenSCG-928-A19]|nr:hypothetical protein [Eubacteriales bacterium OttesenSCG-928-A19]